MPEWECGFPENQNALVLFGPTLQSQIGFDLDYQPETGNPPNLPDKKYHALVDTGAAISCIDNSVASALRLPVIDEGMISGVSGRNKVNIYLAQIYIPVFNFTQYGSFHGVDLHAGGQLHSALLGRSFLRYMKMEYKGDTSSVLISLNKNQLQVPKKTNK